MRWAETRDGWLAGEMAGGWVGRMVRKPVARTAAHSAVWMAGVTVARSVDPLAGETAEMWVGGLGLGWVAETVCEWVEKWVARQVVWKVVWKVRSGAAWWAEPRVV